MRRAHLKQFAVFALVAAACACSAIGNGSPTTRPTTRGSEAVDESFFDPVVKVLGKGTFRDGVYTISRPRTDLEVGHIDLGDIPAAAGLVSTFYFFKCPCGKMNAVGQFCVADYEVQAVVDELRNSGIQLVSITPMFLGERPRIMAIRFQARANADVVAEGIRNALRWIGEERMQ